VTALNDHQFEILPSPDAVDGFVFGIGAAVSLDDGGFDPGEANWFDQTGDNTRRGVRGFGRDIPSPKTWTWESHVNRDSVENAVDTLEKFATAWSPDAALTPGWVTAVRYRLAGRNRRVFGRPRRFAAPPSNLILSGYVPVTHDFDLVDSYVYDDVESSAQILYSSSAADGGFTLPSSFPLTTMPSTGTGSEQLTVGGSARTYPIIRFNGPWTNPVFKTDDWELRWTGSIPVGGWVEVDLRPWQLTVLNQSGASVVSGLSRATWFEDMWFAPQSQPQISLSGVAASGGAGVVVRWRNAWKSI